MAGRDGADPAGLTPTEVDTKRPFPQGIAARERVRDAVLAKALRSAEQNYLTLSISMKCRDAIIFGRTVEQHDCRNTGATCLCQCHDLTVREHDDA